MSTEDNKAIVRRMYEEVWNKGNVDAVDELCAWSYVNWLASTNHSSAPGRILPSRYDAKQFISQLLAAFPDLHVLIDFQVAEEDLVVTHGAIRGTHKGEYNDLEFKGIPPTGNQVIWTFTSIESVNSGKIQQSRLNDDSVSRLQQIGAIPTPGKAQ
jgi:predicted ester cyclase